MIVALVRDVRERTEQVEARKQRHRQALAARVEPERRRSAQDADAVARPDRRIVLNAFRVVPHAVGVDEVRARGFRDIEHQAVDMLGHARDHVARRLAEALRPIAAHQFMIAADAARRDDDRLRAQRERAGHAARAWPSAFRIARLQHLALQRHRSTPPVFVNPVTRWRKRNETRPRLRPRARAARRARSRRAPCPM